MPARIKVADKSVRTVDGIVFDSKAEAAENGIDTNAQLNIMLRRARDVILAERGRLHEFSRESNNPKSEAK